MLGETEDVGQFYQTVWVARTSAVEAVEAASRHLAEAGDTLVAVERCESVDEPVPRAPDISATGRAYFEEQ